MNIVTMCRGGNVRSVAAKMVLQRYFGHEVIAIGADNTNHETKNFLAKWADIFVVMNRDFLDSVPSCFVGQVIVLDVGNDVWGDPFSEDLQMRAFNLAFLQDKLHNPAVSLTRLIQSRQEIPKRIREYKNKIAERNAADAIA